MDFLYNYGLFFAKTFTVLACFLLAIFAIVAINMRQGQKDEGSISISKINERFDALESAMLEAVLDHDTYKEYEKSRQKEHKQEKRKRKKELKKDPVKSKKNPKNQLTSKFQYTSDKKRMFVLSFDGDIRASEVEFLREEITAILLVANKNDEVLLKLESAGGLVHPYGLAAAQLQRLRDNDIPLTIAVDQVAASGGYMMACVASQILAAPFAVLGSIGVIAQLPNFNRLLKKHDIDFEMHTAGKYKRTLTVFGENSKEARNKFCEDLEDTHVLFKEFVQHNRPQIDINQIATGEIWYGQQALAVNLIDKVQTSDEYLLAHHHDADIYEVEYSVKKGFSDKLSEYIELQMTRLGIYQ